MTMICLKTPTDIVGASLLDNPIADALLKALPVTSVVHRWGDEIYFDVPVRLPNFQPTRTVEVGDLAYWPDGPSLCIFFGRTPASRDKEPRPASDVTVIGHTDVSPALLRAIEGGTPIEVLPSEPAKPQRPAHGR